MKSVLDPTTLPELIGKPHDSEMVLELFKELGIEWADVRCIDRDLQQYSWDSYEKGLQLDFEDEGELLDMPYHDPGEGPFILTNIGFWGGVDEFTAYSGPLLKGIKMTDDQDTVLEKIASPDEQNEFGIWIWYGTNYQMTIEWENPDRIRSIVYWNTPNA